MSRQPSKTFLAFPSSAIRGISLSLGIVLMLGSATPSSAQGIGDALRQAADQLLTPNRNQNQDSDRAEGDSKPSPDSQTENEDSSEPEVEEQPTAEGPRFTCELANGQYMVMYHPEGQTGTSYPWATPTALGGGWSPEARCNEISRRLEFYRPDGMIELKTAVENNYNTICVTTQANAACRIVLTVPPGQDPIATRDRIFQNLTVADSGQQTDAVNTFTAGSQDGKVLEQILGTDPSTILGGGRRQPQQRITDGINLRPFLAPSDGGTGANLRGARTLPRANPRLNPDRFR